MALSLLPPVFGAGDKMFKTFSKPAAVERVPHEYP
jgi:hypothetical protein